MLGHYCTTAVRNFARRPLSTAIKLFALALGFACFLTASFIADYVARVDRQWANDGRIYSILQAVTAPGAEKESGPTIGAISPPAVEFLKTDFPDITIAATQTLQLPISVDGKQQTYNVLAVDPEFIRIFDLDVTGGRAEALNEPTSVLLEAAAALELFGPADPVGRTVRIAAGDVTVAGVVRLPSPSHLGAGGIGKNARAFISREALPKVIQGYPTRFPPFWAGTCCTTYMLQPENGPSLAEIQARLDKFSAARVPPEFGKIRFAPLSLGDMGKAYLNLGLFGGSLDLSLVTILRVFAALILAVACLDFANLATAEAAARSREIGVRKTVGASRGQVVTQTILEAGLLTVLALAIVLPLTLLVVTPLAAAIRLQIALADVIGRPQYWLGLLAVAVAVCAAAGAYPALVLARVRPIFSLRVSVGQRAGAAVVRTALTVAQFAVASFLLAAVAVMLLQRAELRGRLTDPARDPRLTLAPPGPPFDSKAFRNELLAHPSVTGFTATGSQPFRRAVVTGIPSATVARSEDPNATRVPVQTRSVFYGYFDVAGIRVLAGRDFDEVQDPAVSWPTDDEMRAPSFKMPMQHVIVDERLAARLGFTPLQAIGELVYQPRQTIGEARLDAVTVPAQIVGVVAATPLEYMAEGPDSYLYFSNSEPWGTLLLRVARNDVAGALAHIDATWQKFFRDRPVDRQFLDEAFDANFRMFDMLGNTFIGLSCVAVVIAALGLFGIASFAVQRRAREIGVRKTMGASKRSVLALMLWDFSKLVILGNVIAWPFVWLAARTYLDLFVQRIDLSPAPFVFALVVSLVIAWLAVLSHALRAAQVQPALVLKTE